MPASVRLLPFTERTTRRCVQRVAQVTTTTTTLYWPATWVPPGCFRHSWRSEPGDCRCACLFVRGSSSQCWPIQIQFHSYLLAWPLPSPVDYCSTHTHNRKSNSLKVRVHTCAYIRAVRKHTHTPPGANAHAHAHTHAQPPQMYT